MRGYTVGRGWIVGLVDWMVLDAGLALIGAALGGLLGAGIALVVAFVLSRLAVAD